MAKEKRMPIKIERKRWYLKGPYGDRPLARWDSTELKRFVTFLTKSGLEVPRLVNLRLQTSGVRDNMPPIRKAGESRNTYRRRVRRWRREHHGSISKMRAAKKEQRVKEQRWALLREQGFPLRDPESLIWFIKSQMWNEKNKLVSHGYLRTSVLVEVAGGALPTGIDFDEVFANLTRDGKARHYMRQDSKARHEEKPPTVKERLMQDADKAARATYNMAKFRIRNSRYDYSVRVNDPAKGESGPTLTMVDSTKPRRGRNRHFTDVTVRVDLSWYRKVYKRGLANAAGERSFVLDVVRLNNGEERALVARQASPRRYELTVGLMRFGKNNDGTYWFEEA